MRVAVDTNIFISSFFGGLPREIIELWKTGRIELCLTSTVLEEYMEVLSRMGMAKEKEGAELLELFRKRYHCHFAARTPSLKLCDDPDDDKFIEAAVALKAKAIVSGDKALLRVKEYVGIRIYTPREFLKFLGK